MKLNGVSVVEFNGNGCSNCISMMPLLNGILKDRKDVNLFHISLDENFDYVEKYKIDRVPTIIVFKDEKEIARCRGFQIEEILSIWLDDKIETAKKER